MGGLSCCTVKHVHKEVSLSSEFRGTETFEEKETLILDKEARSTKQKSIQS